MSRKKKVLLAGGCGCLTLPVVALGVLALIPFLFKDQVGAMVIDTLEESVDADIAFTDVSVGVFGAFPDLEVEITGLTVTGKGDFEGVVLADMPTFAVAVDLWSAIGATDLVVRSVRLDDATFTIVVNEDGKANYDIAIAGDEAASEEVTGDYSLSLDGLDVSNLTFNYDDHSTRQKVAITGLDHSASGSLSQDVMHFTTRTDIASITVRDGGIAYLSNAVLGADFALDYDQNTGGMVFGDNAVDLNGLVLGFAGKVDPKGDDYDLDVTYEAKQSTFKSVLSLVPAIYLRGYEDIETDGKVSLTGEAKGLYKSTGDHLPSFVLDADIDDAWLKYPDLPGKVSDVRLDLMINHPEGALDLLEVDLNNFHMSVAGQPFDLDVSLRNVMSDPYIDMGMHGSLDLAKLGDAIPMEDGRATGTLVADLDVKGKSSDFQAQNTSAITATGTFEAQGLTVDTVYMPEQVTVKDVGIELSPSRAEVRRLDLRFGRSDLDMNGTFDNLMPYMLGQAPLEGSLTARSKVLDLIPFQGEEEEGEDTDESYIVVVPDDLDLRLKGRAKKVFMEGWDFTNARGTVLIKDGVVTLEDVELGIAGGYIGVDGTYTAEDTEAADVDFDVRMVKLDVAEAVRTFTSFKALAPIVESAMGHFSTDLKMTTRLGRDLSPDPTVMFSSGAIQTIDISVAPALMKLISAQTGNRNLERFNLYDTVIGYEIKDGSMKVKPTSLKLGTRDASFSGVSGIVDRTLDFALTTKMPASSLQGGPLGGQVAALAGDVDLNLKIGGTWDKPKVGVGLGDLAGNLADVATEAVLEQVGEAAEDLIAAATVQGDKLVVEAEKLASSIRSEGKKAGAKLRTEANRQADKLVRDAGGNPIKKAAAKEAAKRIKATADKKATGIEREADNKANKVETEARGKRDSLIAEAQAKTNR
jgi:hypothetical protein